MTTRWRKKASSVLAIVAVIVLLLLIIFLWTAARNGVFSTQHANVKISINDHHKNDPRRDQIAQLLNNGKLLYVY